MKIATLLAASVLVAKLAAAQDVTLERYVIGTAGTSRTAEGLYLSATAGQAAVGTRTAGEGVFTQGFQQQWLETEVSRATPLDAEISLFPNPTDGVFVISGIGNGVRAYAEAFDLVGKQIELRRDGFRFEFPPNAAGGVYPVRLTLSGADGTTNYFHFKIQLYR